MKTDRTQTVEGNIVDLHQGRIYHGIIEIENGIIRRMTATDGQSDHFILPGFVDAHVHIESSMLVPSEFARLSVLHGTVATVSDPHEIANVLGTAGVEYMIANSNQVPFKFFFGAPSCVPATSFETAGANIDADATAQLLDHPQIHYLAEMMNFPGVLHGDVEVLKKLEAAKARNKPIDGHAPGLRAKDARAYFAAGITTDHECFTYEEALEKVKLGVRILIREGSAAKNFDALIPLFDTHPDQLMFCSDDKHPDDLLEGHINQLVSRAVGLGYDLWDVLKAACIQPVNHYRLPVGLLRQGDPADFILVKDLEKFETLRTYIDGHCVAENGRCLFDKVPVPLVNKFNVGLKKESDFQINYKGNQVRVIEAIDGEIVTRSGYATVAEKDGKAMTDPGRDLLKITVVNRYREQVPALAFIRGFGLHKGAIASTVAHDSHNIVAVGCDDAAIRQAVNALIKNKGGIAAVCEDRELVLALPVAGLMSDLDGREVAAQYSRIDEFVKTDLGSFLTAPFMTLSFMALLVIPTLKLSDRGLFDGEQFAFVDNFLKIQK